MSRQRLRESSVKWKISLTNETFALKILKMIEIQIIESKAKIVDLNACEQICSFIENNLKENLKFIEGKHKIKISFDFRGLFRTWHRGSYTFMAKGKL